MIQLLRHGEVRGGTRFRGSTDDGLTLRGWQQMETAVAPSLRWQAVVSSPLRRCADFAHELVQALHVPLTVDPRLREIHFGAWEGRSPEDIAHAHPGALERFWREPWRHTPPGGEPLTAFRDRVLSAWVEVLNQRPGPVLLITHAGVIRCILGEVYKRPLTELMQRPIDHGSVHVVLRLQSRRRAF